MPLEIGTIVAVAAALLFYLRLILLQRQRTKQLAEDHSKGNKKTNRVNPNANWVVIKNWYLVGLGIALILAGALLSAVPAAAAYRAYWWIPVTAGILLMTLGIG